MNRAGFDYLEAYLRGEYARVWVQLQTLGPRVRQEPVYSSARRVADETMRRVRRDCERIVDRLHSLGYAFGTYPDGSTGYYTPGPLVSAGPATRADQAKLEAAVGPLPLSLMSFWEQVGSVDLVGMLPGWPTGLDPLVVNPPEACVSELDDMDQIVESYGQFEASLAPDDLHKDNISGGSPYTVRLPDFCADFTFRYERHGMLFVPYLRMAILRFGGFPGLEGREPELSVLGSLIEGLEPF